MPRVKPGEDTVQDSFTLHQEHIEKARRIGGGNKSRGMRIMIDAYQEDQPKRRLSVRNASCRTVAEPK